MKMLSVFILKNRKKITKVMLCCMIVSIMAVCMIAPASAASTDALDVVVDGAKTVGSAFYGVDGIWSSFMTFITTPANVICLIPLFAWLLVMGIGAVRRLYTG